MIYTSSNGFIFTLLNKAGEIGVRGPKVVAAIFMEKTLLTLIIYSLNNMTRLKHKIPNKYTYKGIK